MRKAVSQRTRGERRGEESVGTPPGSNSILTSAEMFELKKHLATHGGANREV
jgi:hypothetical protein